MQQLTYLDHLWIILRNWGALFVLAGLAVSAYGLYILIQAQKRGRPHRSWERMVGGVLLIVSGLLWSYLQTLVPTRYASNPVGWLSPEQIAAAAGPIYAESLRDLPWPKGPWGRSPC